MKTMLNINTLKLFTDHKKWRKIANKIGPLYVDPNHNTYVYDRLDENLVGEFNVNNNIGWIYKDQIKE